jgi:predicted nuclease of predicted toxin-antitoxin system
LTRNYRRISWIAEHFQIEVRAVRDLGLRDTKDPEIFRAARAADVLS